MSQYINTNIASLNAQRNLSASNGDLTRSIQRLSSGLRVNSAKDDAAGLAIATRMDAQIRGMNVAIRNTNDGISLAQVADGSLGKLSDLMQRMRELAVQSANATNNTDDKDNLHAEYAQLSAELTRTRDSTNFNGNALFDAGVSFTFQVGAGSSTTDDQITVTGSDLSVAAFTAVTSSGIGAAGDPAAAITAIDAGLDLVNTERAKWGAVQNRFEAVISTLQVGAESQSAARSRIMDADFAKETASLTRAQILQQAGTAMLAQANQVPQQVLQLLKG